MPKFALLLLLLTTACSVDPLVSAHEGEWRWEEPVVTVSYAECETETEQALAFWRAQGVTYLDARRVDASELSDNVKHQPWYSIEIVRFHDDETPHGVTYVLGYKGTQELAIARTMVNFCDAALIAHELGHALGLGHVEDNTVMRANIDGATRWELSDAEREWVSREN